MGCIFCPPKNMNLTLADIVNIVFVSSATVGGDVVIANFDPKNLYTDNSGALYVQCHPMSHWNLLFSVYQKDGLVKCSDSPATTPVSSIVFPYVDKNGQSCFATLTLVTNNYNATTKALTIRVNVVYEKVLNLSSPQNDVDGTYHVDNRIFFNYEHGF